MYLVKISTTATNKTFGAQKSKSTKEIQQALISIFLQTPKKIDIGVILVSYLLLMTDDLKFQTKTSRFWKISTQEEI